MKKKTEVRYIVTDVVSIPVIRITGKTEAYKIATKPGWGVVEWYSAINNYKAPVSRDTTDKTQQLVCDEDTSATLYPRYGREFCIAPYDEIDTKEMPRQAELDAIIISDACGFSFWTADDTDVKIFVTYDENGLIDTYRLDNWNAKPYDGETEITFADLQSEADHDSIDRADIDGTFENSRKLEAAPTPNGRTVFTMNETKTVYMIVVANKFGVLYIPFYTDYREVMAIATEELAKGRRVKVADRKIPA